MQFQFEDLSAETCILMNSIGYGQEIIKARRDFYSEFDRIANTLGRGGMVKFITSGSKGEGLTFIHESDVDFLNVIETILCLEDGFAYIRNSYETTVLRLQSRMCYPGHYRLLLETQGTSLLYKLANALCADEYGDRILSSELFINVFRVHLRPGGFPGGRAGPSLPSSVGAQQMDQVFALRCHCPSILQSWAARPRHWPPPQIVHKLQLMTAVVTPVGFKLREYTHLEWRVCFNAGEKELVSNFNDVQLKLYVLLKMIKKDIIKPSKKEVTSYTLKNIVLWLAEKNPQALFHEKSLVHWLHEALCYLRTVISTQQLPYYMIPERKLMEGCGLETVQIHAWVATITELVNEGPRIVLRLPKLRQALIARPEPLLWFSKKRIEIELLELMYMNRRIYCTNKKAWINYSDTTLKEIQRRSDMILEEVRQRMNMEGSRVTKLQDV